MKARVKRLSWAKNLEMVALLEKVYAWYTANTDLTQVTMMELKWATAFTFVRLANRFRKDFGTGLDYADYAYSAFCQIDTRFRMRTGYGDNDNAKIRVAEKRASTWWASVTEAELRGFITADVTSWPITEQRIFLADKNRRNTAASASNIKRRIAEEKKVHPVLSVPDSPVKKHERVELSTTLSSLPQVIRSLVKKYPGDPIVSLSFIA